MGATYPVVSVLPGSDSDTKGLESLADGSVTNDIVRGSRLLDEPRLEGLEDLHVLDRLRDVPYLCTISAESEAEFEVVRLASTMRTQPVGPAFFPSIVFGSIGLKFLGRLAGSSMMERMSMPLRRSSCASAPTLSCNVSPEAP
jgi:hypothetical protein